MGDTQNLTSLGEPTTIYDLESQVTPQQQSWIDYKAMGGIVFDKNTDSMRKMSVLELSQLLGVSRETLYAWRGLIPNFWERVAERRKEIGSEEWLVKMHDAWKLKALKLDNWQVTEAWLINFDPSYKAPKLKVEHGVSDELADIMNLARNRHEAIDAEVVDTHDD